MTTYFDELYGESFDFLVKSDISKNGVRFVEVPKFIKNLVENMTLEYKENECVYDQLNVEDLNKFEGELLNFYRELGYEPCLNTEKNSYEYFLASGDTKMVFDFHQEKDESPNSMTLLYYFETNCENGNYEYIPSKPTDYISGDGIELITAINGEETISIDIRKHNCFLFNSEIFHRGAPITSGKRGLLSLHVIIH